MIAGLKEGRGANLIFGTAAKSPAARPGEPASFEVEADHAGQLIELALREDIGAGDITGLSVIPAQAVVCALVVLKEQAVLAGLPVMERVFKTVDAAVDFQPMMYDGARVEAAPAQAARVRGPGRSVLAAERTALNFLQRLSGIATNTSWFVERAAPHGIAVLDTRKTTPALRCFEKYAVAAGGGSNHRFGLFDAILIKENHLLYAGGVREAVRRARLALPGRPVEVEVTTAEEVRQAVESGADAVLLDNMSPALVRQSVGIVGGRCRVEVSGGINRGNFTDYLIEGVDAVSIGALTHSARNMDISLEVMPEDDRT